jgi:hypothetical protein
MKSEENLGSISPNFFAMQKDTGVQLSEKNFPFDFTNKVKG